MSRIDNLHKSFLVLLLLPIGSATLAQESFETDAKIQQAVAGWIEIAAKLENVRGVSKLEEANGDLLNMKFLFHKSGFRLNLEVERPGSSFSKIYGMVPDYVYKAIRHTDSKDFYVDSCGNSPGERQVAEIASMGLVGKSVRCAIIPGIDVKTLEEIFNADGFKLKSVEATESNGKAVEVLTFSYPLSATVKRSLKSDSCDVRVVCDPADHFKIIESESKAGDLITTTKCQYADGYIPSKFEMTSSENGKATTNSYTLSEFEIGTVTEEECGLPAIGLPGCAVENASTKGRLIFIGANLVVLGVVVFMFSKRKPSAA